MDDPAAAAFRSHYGALFQFVRRRVGSDAEAEDLTQSVFVQAAAHLESAKGESGPVLAWLYTVAQHRLVDESRRKARRGANGPLELASLTRADPCYGSEVASALRDALAGLPESNRSVVVMRLIQGRKFADIAQQLGTSEAACKMRFVRGLAAVRKVFKQEGLEP
jgi:RNA polymerase sigma factor (sigma-70 family)